MGLNQLKVNETTDGKKNLKTVLNSNVHTTNLKEVLKIWKKIKVVSMEYELLLNSSALDSPVLYSVLVVGE